MVVGPLENGWRHPEVAFSLRGCREGDCVVVGEYARLQLAYPVHPGGYPKTRLALELPFEPLLLEPLVAKVAENRRRTAERPYQPQLCADEADDETETSAVREAEAGLGFALHVRQRSAAREKLREEVVAADRRVSKVADLLRGFEGVPGDLLSCPNMPCGRLGEIAEGQVDAGSQAFHSRLFR